METKQETKPAAEEEKPQEKPAKEPFSGAQRGAFALMVLVLVVLIGGGVYFLNAKKAPVPAPIESSTPSSSQESAAVNNDPDQVRTAVLSFNPESTTVTPLTVGTGKTFPMEVRIDPGQHEVTFVKLEITYDPKKLAPASDNAFVVDPAFSNILEGPTYTSGRISVAVSVGANPQAAVKQKGKVGTVTFKALAGTDVNTPTSVAFDASTQALSISANDKASANIVGTTIPAAIAIK